MKEKLCQIPSEYAGQSTTTISLEMPVELFKKLKETATMDGTDHLAMINCFVEQGLSNSVAEVKRLHFEEHAKKILEKHGVQANAVDEIFNKLEF